jgi:hypothetical protein
MINFRGDARTPGTSDLAAVAVPGEHLRPQPLQAAESLAAQGGQVVTMISNTVAASGRCLCSGQGVGPGRRGGGPRGRSRAERELDPPPGAENP